MVGSVSSLIPESSYTSTDIMCATDAHTEENKTHTTHENQSKHTFYGHLRCTSSSAKNIQAVLCVFT